MPAFGDAEVGAVVAAALCPARVQTFVRSWAQGAPQGAKGVTLLVYCLTPGQNPGECPEGERVQGKGQGIERKGVWGQRKRWG